MKNLKLIASGLITCLLLCSIPIPTLASETNKTDNVTVDTTNSNNTNQFFQNYRFCSEYLSCAEDTYIFYDDYFPVNIDFEKDCIFDGPEKQDISITDIINLNPDIKYAKINDSNRKFFIIYFDKSNNHVINEKDLKNYDMNNVYVRFGLYSGAKGNAQLSFDFYNEQDIKIGEIKSDTYKIVLSPDMVENIIENSIEDGISVNLKKGSKKTIYTFDVIHNPFNFIKKMNGNLSCISDIKYRWEIENPKILKIEQKTRQALIKGLKSGSTPVLCFVHFKYLNYDIEIEIYSEKMINVKK